MSRRWPQSSFRSTRGTKSINYNGLNALTIEAIKELRAQNEALKADVEELKKSLN